MIRGIEQNGLARPGIAGKGRLLKKELEHGQQSKWVLNVVSQEGEVFVRNFVLHSTEKGFLRKENARPHLHCFASLVNIL